MLKASGIILIIGGALSVIMGIIALLGVGTLAVILDLTEGIGLLYSACILSLAAGVFELTAGIIGVKNCKIPEKAQTCMVFGIIVIVMTVLVNILNVVAGNKIDLLSLILGVILPAVYVYGAFLNKQ